MLNEKKVEYMVEGRRLDGAFFGRRYFTDKQKAYEYQKALEQKYGHLTISLVEV